MTAQNLSINQRIDVQSITLGSAGSSPYMLAISEQTTLVTIGWAGSGSPVQEIQLPTGTQVGTVVEFYLDVPNTGTGYTHLLPGSGETINGYSTAQFSFGATSEESWGIRAVKISSTNWGAIRSAAPN